jgi:hypothetical protein
MIEQLLANDFRGDVAMTYQPAGVILPIDHAAKHLGAFPE